jgi:hypothetical protein
MSDFFDTYDETNGELLYLTSLLTAAICVREHRRDLQVISDLLYLMDVKVKVVRGLVRIMNDQHRKLEKEMEKPASPKTMADTWEGI